MTQLESFALLILAACMSYVLSCIFDYINRCTENFRIKKYKKDDFFKFKCKKLHDNMFFYYFDLIETRPEQLCYDLASRDLNRVIKDNKVTYFYDLLKKQDSKKAAM